MQTNTGTGAVAVVTGAAGLIGREIATERRQRGYQVVAIDNVSASIDGATMFEADIADPDVMSSVAARVGEKYGRVDQLVLAAALTARSPGPGLAGALVTLEPQIWRAVIDINLTGTLICVQRFRDLLLRSARPKIVIVGSIQGLVPTTGTGAYGVSKWSLVGLTRQLAVELADVGIAVNMVAPGPIAESAVLPLGVGDGSLPTPMHRFGTPAEVARAIGSIMEPPFDYMTGVVIPLDGGEHLRPRYAPVREDKREG